MYIPMTFNGKEVSVLMDMGATYNFVSTKVSDHLTLKSMINTSMIKVLNLPVK